MCPCAPRSRFRGVVPWMTLAGGLSMSRLTLASLLVAAVGVTAFLPAASAQVNDSRHALGSVVPELNVEAVPLERALNFLRDTSGANIVVNWKVLETLGVAKDTPVTLQVRNLPLRKMLQLVLDQASPNSSLVYNIDSNVIQITSQEDADRQMVTKVYVVDDLVMAPNVKQAPTLNLGQTTQQSGGGGGGFGGGGSQGGQNGGGQGGLFGSQSNNNQPQNVDLMKNAQQRGEDLVALIREVVRPTIWRENGGTASIRYFNPGKIIVTAPLSVHEAIGGPVGNTGIRFGS